MKNIKLGIVTGIAALAAFSSCKKTDLYPYNAIERSQSFKTVKDAGFWDTGIHAFIKGRVNGLYTFSQDIQADQLNASLDYGNNNGNPHRMNDSFNSDDYTLRDVWQGYYNGINNTNVAIAGYKALNASNAAETDSLNKYSGGAHLARAFYYHNLVLRFSKAYNQASAGTDLGVPLQLEYDPSAKPARASLAAVYNQILSDIAEAKTKLVKVVGKPGASRLNVDAAVALEARVKLEKKDYPGAYAAAISLIDAGKYPLYNTPASVQSYWYTDTRGEDIIQLHGTVQNLFNTNGGQYLGYNPGVPTFTPNFIPTQSVIDLFDNADSRKAVYFQPKHVTISGVVYNNTIQLVNKYPGNPALFTGANTNYQHFVKLFRIGEQYLIAAEAAYFNNGDETNARKYLNLLRVARGLTATTATGPALFTEIKNERQRELAFEGFRLFDLKRWNEGIVRGTPQNTAPLVVVPATDFISLNKPANFLKIVWGIPANDVVINTNIVQNDGWK